MAGNPEVTSGNVGALTGMEATDITNQHGSGAGNEAPLFGNVGNLDVGNFVNTGNDPQRSPTPGRVSRSGSRARYRARSSDWFPRPVETKGGRGVSEPMKGKRNPGEPDTSQFSRHSMISKAVDFPASRKRCGRLAEDPCGRRNLR